MPETKDFSPLYYPIQNLEPSYTVSSYWQRVWLSFRHNRAGLVASIIIVMLIAWSFLGAGLNSTDTQLQNVSNRFASRQAAAVFVIVDDNEWHGVVSEKATIHMATTESIQLSWPDTYPPYSVSRTLADGSQPLLFSDIKHAWYEDRFDLSYAEYHYQIRNAEQTIIAEYSLTPNRAMSRFYAELAAYIPIDSGIDKIELSGHALGTDALGRDILARLMEGGRISLSIGILAPLLAIAFGALYGAVSAYLGGVVDEVLMRIADVVIALPFLLFVILLNVAFGYGPASDGVAPMFLALVLMGWPNAAKLVRGQVLLLRKAAYIEAAVLMGASKRYILYTHLLPSVLGAVLVALSFAIPNAIFTEALLSFLGLGVTAPAASWGSLCQESMSELQRHPHLLLFPALLISMTVLAFNLLGDSLRDALAEASGASHD